jgi:hypothetical protein
MGELLGLGVTHYPPLAGTDENMADLVYVNLDDPAMPARLQDPQAWPERLRAELGDDRGQAAAREHRREMRVALRTVRAALDQFEPDAVLIWGDDQYELFRETCIPAFCVLALDDIAVRPWSDAHARENAWGESSDAEVLVRGARDTAKELTKSLLEQGFDMAYAYEIAAGMDYPHAFLNTVLYLDYERRGFDYPVLPISVNCYGERVIKNKGGMAPLAELDDPATLEDLDPPGPTPDRCMRLGAAVARFVLESDLRVAVVASSSWSHAFLTDKHYRLYPDTDADRSFFATLQHGDYDAWRGVDSAALVDSGQHEMLNWFCLAGAMAQAGHEPAYCELVESHAFNSNKCFGVFAAPGYAAVEAGRSAA